MLSMLKALTLSVYAGCAFPILVPFVRSSQEHSNTDHFHASNRYKIHEMSPELSYEITVHGFLLWASMGFLMPVGILIIRMSQREECGRRLKVLFYIHALLQLLSLLLATAAAVLSIKNLENSFNNDHQKMGLALYGVIWLQALIGILRPHKGIKGRSIWFFIHWIMGITISILGIINVYTGLQAYHKKTARRIRAWTVIFTVEISFILFFYLCQEKWDYIQKQGVIIVNEPIQPTDQDISPRGKQREKSALRC